MEDADVWVAVREERLEIVDRLAELTADQWDSPSLCSEWRIRDVVGHLTAAAQGGYKIGAMLGGMFRNGLNLNRYIASDGRERGAQDPSISLQALRTGADSRWSPPGAPKVSVLSDVVVHAQDMYRPLGIERQVPPSHLRAVADMLTRASGFGTRKRLAGLRLVATDIDWTHGEGLEVSGPAEALVMIMAGRVAALDDLAGAGKETLAGRC